MDLRGTTCLVTGANRGIGLAIAHELARRPLAELLVAARDPDRAPDLTPPPGGAASVRTVRMDLSSPASIAASATELGDDLRRIDVLVNNAGLLEGGLLENQDLERVYAMLQVNLLAVIDLTWRVLPGMLERGRGKIVNNASISGYAFLPAATTYAASKAGVVAFSEALRREVRGTGVSVLHLVTPGVRTEMLAETEEAYAGHLDTSSWETVEPGQWAARVVEAILDDRAVLDPPGKARLAKIASRAPARVLDRFAARWFDRDPRR